MTFALAVVLGAAAAWYYAHAGLTLSHYDARAHLVVARRVFDSLTPGWRQFGAIWLPLPHLLNLVPVQWDWSYRTGFSGVALSIGVLAWGLGALSRYLMRHTGSAAIAIAVPLAILGNPAVLYLQSTPMTEPLFFGLALVSLLCVDTWVATGRPLDAQRAGLVMAALLLTRYEGWLVAAALIAMARALRPRPRAGWWWLAAWPGLALLAFTGLTYATTGALVTPSDFFAPTNPARGSVTRSLAQVFLATEAIAGPAIVALGAAGLIAAIVQARRTRGRSLLCLGLLASAVLPFGAFYAGHPQRVRYMVAITVGAAACGALGLAALPRRVRTVAAGLFLTIALVIRPPLSSASPVIAESQWEAPYSRARQAVTAYLGAHHDGTPILASMGALAHYMQQTTPAGLSLRDFLHEGNGDLWEAALASPGRYVRWILIEEQARGGGILAQRARSDPHFLDGFVRVAEGGGVSLYRRTSP